LLALRKELNCDLICATDAIRAMMTIILAISGQHVKCPVTSVNP
jgi:hypothetical protein